MNKSAWIVCIVLASTVGCAEAGPVVWHEGENFTVGPTASALETKLSASGGKCLTGRALRSVGARIVYDVRLPVAMPAAKLHLRYSRFHWREMPASTVDVELTMGERRVIGKLTLGDTGG